MNIFVLDTDHQKAAQMYTDKHNVKMILEHVQIMSSVCHKHGHTVTYKPTHANHPCTIWAGRSKQNYQWLKDLTTALNSEWKYRFNHTRNHKSYDVMLELPVPNLPDIGLTDFAQAMPDQFRGTDAVKAYRRYYKYDKAHLHTFTKRTPPAFLTDGSV